MTVRYLLDTNIASDLIRNPRGRAGVELRRVGANAVGVSIIVAVELHFGALKKGSPTLAGKVDALLDSINVMPLESPVQRVYAGIRVRLEAQGLPIGTHDYLIAAHALTLDCALVTDNEGEFSRVDGLKIENWLRG